MSRPCRTRPSWALDPPDGQRGIGSPYRSGVEHDRRSSADLVAVDDSAPREPSPDGELGDRATTSSARTRWTLLAVIALVVVGILAGAWWSTRRDSDVVAAPPAAGPVVATHAQLVAIARASGHSVYWAGLRGSTTFETTVSGRNVYVRYLPDATQVGTTATYLTVGTYERANAYQGLVALESAPGATSRQLAAGALVVVPSGSTSAYFAFPGADLLMEVYDPTPGRALELVLAGAVQPIT